MARKKRSESTGKVHPRGAEASPRLVVGVGASAGGLDPIRSLLSHLKPGCGIAVIVVQHLDAGADELLLSLAQENTKLQVVEATDGRPLLSDHVYLMPGGKSLSVLDGKLSVHEVSRCQGLRMPIDHFFCTLASDQGRRAVGVVLSGSGTDGTQGLAEIRSSGGVAVVQEPSTAAFPEMPANAVAAGHVDASLPPEDIAGVLMKRCQELARLTAEQEQEAALESIFAAVRQATGHDFHCYKRPTLERRTNRRMSLHRLTRYDDYARMLRTDKQEAAALRKDLLIGVTEFFRQPDAWRVLGEKVLAELVARAEAGSTIRAWVPACSIGKEAYSLAMLLAETIERSGKKLALQMFATDADASAVDAARSGLYTEEDLKGVSQSRLRRFFTRKNGRYEVVKTLREQIVFAPQDLLADPPFSKLDLISCRNLLIYLDQAVQRKIIQLFHFAIREKGYLFLGSAETIYGQDNLFEQVSHKWRIYRKLGIQTPTGLQMPLRPATRKPLVMPPGSQAPRPTMPAIAQQALAERFGPPAAIVDRKGTLLYVHGQVEDYLRLSPGEQTGLLADAAREGLRSRLGSAILQAVQENQKVTVTARVKKDKKSLPVKVMVSPLRHREAEGLLLVTFHEQKSRKEAKAAPEGEAGRSDMKQLEDELKITREELSSTIDQLEQSNEQLKASNEEVMAANEELQSSNEELETSKEELQSLNEELNAVNQRLQEKVGELEQSSNDVSNLLTSGAVATIFLDRKLRVRRFTPAVTKLLSLIEGDIGRPIADIVRKFKDDALLDDAKRVLVDLAPIATEVRTDDGEWYSRRILPYRTGDDRIEGVVITFGDVTNLKELTEALRISESQARWLGRFPSENPNPVLRVAADGTVLYRNPVAVNHSAWACEEGQALPQDALRQLLGQAMADGKPIEQDVEMDGADFSVSVVPVPAECYANIYGRDISERKRAEAALRESQDRNQFLADILQRSSQAFGMGYPDGRLGMFNPAFEQLTGYSAEELRQIDWATALTPAEWRDAERVKLEELQRTGQPVRYEKEYVRKDGTRVPIELLVHLARDAEGKPLYYYSFLMDITERKRAQLELERLAQQRRLALDAAKLGWWHYDPVTRMATWDDVYQAIFGFAGHTRPNDEILAQVIHPDDRAGLWAKVEAALNPADPQPYVAEYRINRPDGTMRWVEAHGVVSFEGAGEGRRAVSFVGTVADITERKQAEEALRESEERLRLLLEGVRDYAIIMLDPEGRVSSWNDGARRIKGWTAEEILGQSFSRFYCLDAVAAGKPQAELEIAAAKGRFEEEGWRVRKDGTQFWANVVISPLRDDQGRLRGFAKITRDITERKQAEEALRQLNEELELRVADRTADLAKAVQSVRAERQRFLDVLETLPVVIDIIRADHRIEWANRAYREALGDNQGKLCYASQFGIDEPCKECEAFVPLQTGKPHRWEWTLPSGRTFDIHNFPFTDADGSPMILEMDIDITEQRRAEAVLREAGAYNRSLIEASLDPLVTIGPDGRITDVNAATERVTGRSRQDLVGTDFSDYFTDPAHAKAGYQQVFREGTVLDYPLEVRHQDGHVTPVLYNATVYRGADGQVIGVFAAARDITEKKRNETALREAYETMEQHVAARTAELARSNEDLQQFAYVASHDLQEPLRMVAGFLKLLDDRYKPQLDDKAREYIGFSVEGATRMSRMIADLLAYSRAGTRGIHPAPLDFTGVLKRAEANLRAAIGDSHAVITHDPLPTATADAAQMLQVFQNLLGNAIKFRSPARNPEIHIGVRQEEGRWVFQVKDNGIGLDAKHADRIFQVFQRLHTRDKYEGTGIGLAICKKIVERHGGRIWVESKAGEGSTFYFTLPEGPA